MVIAVIDIGTNSTRLLIARYEKSNVTSLYQDLEITRIGEGLGESPFIKKEALDRTIDCLKRFMNRCREYEPQIIRITATSAVRDAQNKETVIKEVRQNTGIHLEILSGEEEAYLSYLGAVSELTGESKVKVVLDIGGGSTELVYPTGTGLRLNSINIGAVRLAEKPELHKNFPQLFADLDGEKLPEEFALIGVGGTVTTLVALKLKLRKYNPELVHGQTLTLEEVRQQKELLFNLSLEERKKLPGLQPQRADIIPYGALILEELMKKLNCKEIIVSEKDILYGLIITASGGDANKKTD